MKDIHTLSNAELYCFIKQHLAKEFIEILIANNKYITYTNALLETLGKYRSTLIKDVSLNGLAILSGINPVSIVDRSLYADRLKYSAEHYRILQDRGVMTTVSWQKTQRAVFRKILNNIPYEIIHKLIEQGVFTKFCNAVRAQLPERLHIVDVSWMYTIAKTYPFGLIHFDMTEEGYSYWNKIYNKIIFNK